MAKVAFCIISTMLLMGMLNPTHSHAERELKLLYFGHMAVASCGSARQLSLTVLEAIVKERRYQWKPGRRLMYNTRQ